MTSQKTQLQKQLEQQKFFHGINYVHQMAGGIKKLTSNELAYLNHLLTGQPQEEAWRFDPVEIQIPGGGKHHFNIISNPIARARDIIGDAFQKAGNDEIVEGAAYLYAHLVLEHLFNDANRRTAVLATIWLLNSHGVDVDPMKLYGIPIGDLRDEGSLVVLTKKIRSLAEN